MAPISITTVCDDAEKAAMTPDQQAPSQRPTSMATVSSTTTIRRCAGCGRCGAADADARAGQRSNKDITDQTATSSPTCATAVNHLLGID